LAKTIQEILNELKTYFERPDVNAGRWRVAEINMTRERKVEALRFVITVVPRDKHSGFGKLI
jgi:hypothetical protein